MKRKRFTEEQIIGVLKESEAGAKTKELCRKHGISDATFHLFVATTPKVKVMVIYAPPYGENPKNVIK